MQATVQIRRAAASVSKPLAYEVVKRAFDVLVAAFLLLVLSPVFGLCALAIRLESSGPVLFRQERVGELGRRFRMLKFRSMYHNVDPKLHQEYVTAFINGKVASGENKNGAIYKRVNDPRVTHVGRWLRRTSLDELPQLWNVLKGDMSLVGPRPPLQYEIEQYRPEHFERLAVKPGITGLWQVCGRSTTTFEEMVALDCQYVRRRSFLLDLSILIRTIPAVLSARGAY